MSMTQQDCEKLLSTLSTTEHSRLLMLVGHELTILGRSAYEFQGPGVTDPRLLRDINEIQHRVHQQLFSLAQRGESNFSPALLASWLFAEGRPHLQRDLAFSFERAVERFQTTV